MNRLLAMLGVLLLGAAAGCHTKHEIIFEQPKPLEMNVNLSGRLELVVVDARKDLEQITGEKPSQVVTPADIGLPMPAGNSSSTTAPPAGQPSSAAPASIMPDAAGGPVVYLASYPAGVGMPQAQATAASAADAAKERMAQRDGQIRALWSSGAVGEAHTGLVVPRQTLTPAQQKLVDEENADRKTLFAAEAASKNRTEAEVALAHYLARLGYAQKGNWYEKFDKASSQWQWEKWPK